MITCGITGSTGVLGSSFIDKYKNKIKFIKFRGDITNRNDLQHWFKKNDFNIIIHFAALVPTGEVDKDYAYARKVNVEGTQNLANLYIGSKGHQTSADGGGKSSNVKFFNGSLSNINIWNESFNSTIISNISESINASPYIGNIFYPNGFATITHPKYFPILDKVGMGNMVIGNDFSVKDSTIKALQFQGTHLIYENEYQCTVQ